MEINQIQIESSKINCHHTKGYNTMAIPAELIDADTVATGKNTPDQTGVMKNSNLNSVVNFFKKLTRWQRPELEMVPTRLSFLMDGGWHR